MKPKRSTCLDRFRLLSADDGCEHGGGEGYASTWDTINSYGDCIKQGAFGPDVLQKALAEGFVAIEHDWDAPAPATITELRPDDYGLYARWEFHSFPAAQEARTWCQERLERGKTVGLSVAFKIAKGGYLPMDPEEPWEGWEITKIDRLFEFSIVTRPADPNAGVTKIQSAGGPRDGQRLADLSETLLDDAEELLERYTALRDMRASEGRRWSEENRRRLSAWQTRAAALSESLSALLKEPEAKDAERERLSLTIDLQRLRDEIPAGVNP